MPLTADRPLDRVDASRRSRRRRRRRARSCGRERSTTTPRRISTPLPGEPLDVRRDPLADDDEVGRERLAVVEADRARRGRRRRSRPRRGPVRTSTPCAAKSVADAPPGLRVHHLRQQVRRAEDDGHVQPALERAPRTPAGRRCRRPRPPRAGPASASRPRSVEIVEVAQPEDARQVGAGHLASRGRARRWRRRARRSAISRPSSSTSVRAVAVRAPRPARRAARSTPSVVLEVLGSGRQSSASALDAAGERVGQQRPRVLAARRRPSRA